MAERRMFTQKITESDAFIEMPMSSQALYFHLCMNADDDGFVKNPKSIQRLVGCNDDDLKLLIAKRFIIPFETGVIVIKHWRMHNLLRKDRYKETVYTEEKALLFLKKDGAYTLDKSQGFPLPKIGASDQLSDEKEADESVATDWQPNGNQMAPQDRLGKDRVGYIEERKKERNIKKTSTCARTREYEENEHVSHADIMDQFGITGQYREVLENYLRACYLNGHIVPNDVLRDLLSRLDKYYQDDDEAKTLAIRKAMNGGYYDIVELRDAPEVWR